MLKQFPFDESWSLDVWLHKLRGIEARFGKVTDLLATTDDDPPGNFTIVTVLRGVAATANTLLLIEEGSDSPDGATLEFAGTVWIDGSDKKVVKVFRTA